MKDNIFLSIITPTYNRGHLLDRCYRSLLTQPDKDFQWIIVDDGSSDDTETVVSGFVTNLFPITYVRKENGGKHTALNTAHGHIRGEYVLILDSDDYLTEDAVAAVRQGWERYAKVPEIGILTFLKGSSREDPVCTVRDFDTPVDILRYRRICFWGSDCCEVIRSKLFLKFPFPVFPGERFVSECALWNQVAQTHKCVYINQVIYICEYLEDGLSASGRAMRIRNPLGGMFTSQLRMVPKNYLKQRIKYGLLYCCYGFFAGLSMGQILKKNPYKSLTALCMLPGYALYVLWKRKYG